MKNLTAQAVYNADIYLRLSDDDGDKPESNSIKNQREFITEFLKSMPEIRIHAERKDDGFSGVDFFRPGIQEVLQDVRSGAVNCVVVKDLSRLGRNYIETGKVLQEFADHGVRFIAINDGYDTANAQGQASTILLPIKNLMNDSYSRDISVKIRSHLEVKKRKGQFVGAFAAYGYLKSPDDKNQLVVDDYAAEVVRDIFRWKLEGMSQQGIADRLNADGVLSPSEYKRSLGMKYISGFKSNPQAKWSAVAVGRILKNPLYIGVMVQGKSVQWVLDHPAEAAALAEEHLGMKAAVVEAAIPNMGLTFKSAQDARGELDTFYNLLNDFDPSMIGGKLPNDGLYYAG